MTFDDPERQEIEELLPWFVTGRLTSREHERVAQYLERHPALASGLADTVILIPTSGAAAAVTTGSGGVAQVHDVRLPVNGHFSHIGGTPRIDGHVVPRIIDDVPLDARIVRPPIDSQV